MKKKNLNFLLALLAALALVFAFAGCAEDGVDGQDGEDGADAEFIVTAKQVEALLQSIGDETVEVASGGNCWLFASGSMSESAQSVTVGESESAVTGTYYVFSVTNNDNSNAASASGLFTALAELGLGEDGVLTLVGNPCYIDFSGLAESGADATYWLGGAAPTSTSDGYLKVTVQCADWYTLPDELETILIKFTPDSTAGWTT